MSQKFFIEQLKQRFAGRNFITREELFDFYRFFEPELKEATFTWRIYSLKEKNILQSIRKGVYIISDKPQFVPPIDPKLKELARKIGKQFPVAKYCLWNTHWLNDWMIHQPGRFLLLVEVESSAAESVFNFLKDNYYKNVFFKPDDDILDRYVYEDKDSIIVKQLITRSPLRREKGIVFPALEKVMVDLFIERGLFAPCQGRELVHIYNHLHRQYALSITTLLAYAKRRNKKQELIDFITKTTTLTNLLIE